MTCVTCGRSRVEHHGGVHCPTVARKRPKHGRVVRKLVREDDRGNRIITR